MLSQINANLTLVLLFTDEEEEDDKPRPPDDDSVPDMEESFSTDGVGHDVDEYINNNISNDEVGNWNDFYAFLTDLNNEILEKCHDCKFCIFLYRKET